MELHTMAKAIPDAPQPDAVVALKVTRVFCLKGEAQEIGSVVHVTRAVAAELKSYGKAVDYDPDAEAAPKAPKTKKDPQS